MSAVLKEPSFSWSYCSLPNLGSLTESLFLPYSYSDSVCLFEGLFKSTGIPTSQSRLLFQELCVPLCILEGTLHDLFLILQMSSFPVMIVLALQMKCELLEGGLTLPSHHKALKYDNTRGGYLSPLSAFPSHIGLCEICLSAGGRLQNAHLVNIHVRQVLKTKEIHGIS